MKRDAANGPMVAPIENAGIGPPLVSTSGQGGNAAPQLQSNSINCLFFAAGKSWPHSEQGVSGSPYSCRRLQEKETLRVSQRPIGMRYNPSISRHSKASAKSKPCRQDGATARPRYCDKIMRALSHASSSIAIPETAGQCAQRPGRDKSVDAKLSAIRLPHAIYNALRVIGAGRSLETAAPTPDRPYARTVLPSCWRQLAKLGKGRIMQPFLLCNLPRG